MREFDPMAVQIEPHGDLGYRQSPNSHYHYVNGTTASSNAAGYRGPVVAETPPRGTIRVLLLGGSTSHGWGVPDSVTIDAHMRRLLHQRFPNRQFEVVNLGFDGYDSFQDLERLKSDGLRLHPALVIVNSGINDVRNAWYANLKDRDPRTLIWETVLRRLRAEQARGGPTIATRLKHASYVIRAPGYIREQLRRRADDQRRASAVTAKPAAAQPAATPKPDGGPPYPNAADYFEKNIKEITAASLKAGAAVLLSTPASALQWYAPNATSQQTYWVIDAKTTQAYRDELSRRMQLLAAAERAAGHAVGYVAPSVPKNNFLDDCHLTSEGNRVVGEQFIDAMLPLIDDRGEAPRHP
jgi:lysophospholipase L1-like esterase